MSYFSGGADGAAPLRASALLKTPRAGFAGYDEFSFEPPRDPNRPSGSAESDERARRERPRRQARRRQAAADDRPQRRRQLHAEGPAEDRRGRAQIDAEVTLQRSERRDADRVDAGSSLWPSAVVLGVKAGSLGEQPRAARSSRVARARHRGQADQGPERRGARPRQPGHHARASAWSAASTPTTTAPTSRTSARCAAGSDRRPRPARSARRALDAAGQVELIARGARTRRAARPQAAASVWITKQGELWFAQDNDDRIDVLPEKKRYEPGETARLQVRMPFREATRAGRGRARGRDRRRRS